MSAICAVTVMRMLVGDAEGFDIRVPTQIEAIDYVPILALGMLCALGGIAIMRGVTIVEELSRRSRVPGWLRPAVGGLAVGGLALVSPAVLSSGHSALRIALDAPYSMSHIALLIVLKALASAISIGSGFRGGLFFASLFLGALLGKLFAGALALVTTVQALPAVVCALVGMSGLAVAIVGGPLTMAFLALESTGSLPMTVAVLAASVVSHHHGPPHLRLQLRDLALPPARRGDPQRGGRRLDAQPDGRQDDAARVPPRAAGHDDRDVPPAISARQRRPAWSPSTQAGRYAGILATSEAHAATDEAATAWPRSCTTRKDVLLPQMTIKEAVQTFEKAESDELAVVDSAETMRVIGVLTEQFALRRYSEELEKRRRELSGE